MSAHVTRTQKLLMMQYDLFFVPYLIIFGTRFSKVLLSLQAQSNILNKNLETKQLSGLVIIRIFEKWTTEHTNKDSKQKNIWFTQNPEEHHCSPCFYKEVGTVKICRWSIVKHTIKLFTAEAAVVSAITCYYTYISFHFSRGQELVSRKSR